MKRRIIAFGLFTLFLAGLSLTQTRTGSAKSFSSGPLAAERGCAGSPVYGVADLIGAESVSTPLTAYVPATSPPAVLSPAAVESCAPILYCLFAGCWYELLDNTGFDEPSSCAPNWIFPAGYVTPSSSICNTNPFVTTFSKVAVLPYASGFNQSFSVPFEDGTLNVSLIFATVGTPTFNDRIVVELLEGSLVRRRVSIRTDLGPFDCHREDYTLIGDYKGKNLKLRVRSQIVTPGVEYHIDSVNLHYSLM